MFDEIILPTQHIASTQHWHAAAQIPATKWMTPQRRIDLAECRMKRIVVAFCLLPAGRQRIAVYCVCSRMLVEGIKLFFWQLASVVSVR